MNVMIFEPMLPMAYMPMSFRNLELRLFALLFVKSSVWVIFAAAKLQNN